VCLRGGERWVMNLARWRHLPLAFGSDRRHLIVEKVSKSGSGGREWTVSFLQLLLKCREQQQLVMSWWKWKRDISSFFSKSPGNDMEPLGSIGSIPPKAAGSSHPTASTGKTIMLLSAKVVENLPGKTALCFLPPVGQLSIRECAAGPCRRSTWGERGGRGFWHRRLEVGVRCWGHLDLVTAGMMVTAAAPVPVSGTGPSPRRRCSAWRRAPPGAGEMAVGTGWWLLGTGQWLGQCCPPAAQLVPVQCLPAVRLWNLGLHLPGRR